MRDFFPILVIYINEKTSVDSKERGCPKSRALKHGFFCFFFFNRSQQRNIRPPKGSFGFLKTWIIPGLKVSPVTPRKQSSTFLMLSSCSIEYCLSSLALMVMKKTCKMWTKCKPKQCCLPEVAESLKHVNFSLFISVLTQISSAGKSHLNNVSYFIGDPSMRERRGVLRVGRSCTICSAWRLILVPQVDGAWENFTLIFSSSDSWI